MYQPFLLPTKLLVAASLLFSTPVAIASSPKHPRGSIPCESVSCEGPRCGCALFKEGWEMIASCGGHSWSYILEKDNRKLICKGIDGRGGPTETPCANFDGDLKEFKKCAKEQKAPSRI